MAKMQNIESILKEFNLEIPEDQREAFRVRFHENYKTVTDYNKAAQERDDWKTKAETAEETLKGFEGIDPAQVQAELDRWKQTAEDAKADFERKLYDRDFSDALNSEMEAYKFTSEAAKRDVMSQIKAAELRLKDGKILGLSDLVEQIKKTDASAFVDEQQERLESSRARFTQPISQRGGGTGKTKDEIMAIKDRSERRAAIAQNMHLFEGE